MREKIELELERIEKENDVKILFAVESGVVLGGFHRKIAIMMLGLFIYIR